MHLFALYIFTHQSCRMLTLFVGVFLLQAPHKDKRISTRRNPTMTSNNNTRMRMLTHMPTRSRRSRIQFRRRCATAWHVSRALKRVRNLLKWCFYVHMCAYVHLYVVYISLYYVSRVNYGSLVFCFLFHFSFFSSSLKHLLYAYLLILCLQRLPRCLTRWRSSARCPLVTLPALSSAFCASNMCTSFHSE